MYDILVNQPHIGSWNLTRLGSAVSLVEDVKPLQEFVLYREVFEAEYTWLRMQKNWASPLVDQARQVY